MATTSNLILDYSNVRFSSTGMAGHAPQTEEDKTRGYLAAKWRDIPVFRCCLCPFDARDEDQIYAHVFKMHHRAPKPTTVSRPTQTLLFDPSGNEITNLEVPAELPQEEEEEIRAGSPKEALAAELRKIEEGFSRQKRRRS